MTAMTAYDCDGHTTGCRSRETVRKVQRLDATTHATTLSSTSTPLSYTAHLVGAQRLSRFEWTHYQRR
jgi:hypothetical protein